MIEINNVTFSYNVDGEGDFSSDRGNAGDEGNSLHNISLTIPDGQVVVLCGESGCGKTTLTRLINGLIPHYFDDALQGNVLIDGRDVSSQPLYDTARQVGSVFQNPRSQFFNVDTTSEISFGCENLGMPREEILTRLGETVSALHIEKLLNRSIFNLSGGEKQKIACAGAFIMQPRVFVLDEPSSNLDADSILDLRDLLAYLKSLGKTIVLSEHRLYYLREIADRYVYLKDGSLAGDFTAEEFQKLPEERRREMGLRTGNLNTLSMGGAGSLDAGAAAASLGAGTTAQGNPPFPAASAGWKSAAAPWLPTEKSTVPRTGSMNATWSCRT